MPGGVWEGMGWEGQERGGTSISPLSPPRRAEFYFWKQFNGLLITLIGFVSGWLLISALVRFVLYNNCD